ncbi:hypothetical protein AVEN_129197-1 [Araneus ventricosus]|uniref:Uncharacterized protein n=1 Tax=Araneus ventricosus TaxID=182803 RepID=A0A4Y2H970_ARAVE|nr:hypothetical protein AVEN_129197-1 [Araneus ventricosus]
MLGSDLMWAMLELLDLLYCTHLHMYRDNRFSHASSAIHTNLLQTIVLLMYGAGEEEPFESHAGSDLIGRSGLLGLHYCTLHVQDNGFPSVSSAISQFNLLQTIASHVWS